MPSEIKSKDEFLKILPLAYECRIKQHKDYVKIKLRTKRRLYTFKTTHETLNELLPLIKMPNNKLIKKKRKSESYKYW